MDFLGIGPLELLMVFIIILLVLGPNDMLKAGRTLGVFVRKLMTSDGWKAVQTASKEIRQLPNRLAREAALEEFNREQAAMKKDLNNLQAELGSQTIAPLPDAWTSPPDAASPDKTGEPAANDPPPENETE